MLKSKDLQERVNKMQSLFIEDNEEFELILYIATDKENKDEDLFCDIEKNTLVDLLKNNNKKVEDFYIGEYSIVFKKLNFGETVKLRREIFKEVFEGVGAGGYLDVRFRKIKSLIKRWNLKGIENEEPKEEDIKKLHPVIAQAIEIYIDKETGGYLS